MVIPAYNEEKAISSVLDDLEAALNTIPRPREILVIDDGSTDGTAAAAERPGVTVVKRGVNLGYGASLKLGLRQATHDLVVITDADGTYPADRIADLLSAMDSADMVVGARTSQNVHIPRVRRFPKWCLRKLAGFLTRRPIPDLNSGLRVFRKAQVESYRHLLPNGFSFTTTITLAYHSDGRIVRYIPIDYERRTGRSKIRPVADTYNFILLILRTVLYFDPMRIFMPPALLTMSLTGAALCYDIFWLRNLSDKSLTGMMITTMLFGLALLGDLIVRRR